MSCLASDEVAILMVIGTLCLSWLVLLVGMELRSTIKAWKGEKQADD